MCKPSRLHSYSSSFGLIVLAVVLSERIAERVKMVCFLCRELIRRHTLVDHPNLQCEIRSEIYGASDHCPLVMEIDGAL